MRASIKVLAMVIAGGEGTRLHPLTASRCKPALPFGGRHRIIDFVLSNLVNSQVSAIHVLIQYKPGSLIEHLHQAWKSPCAVPQHVIATLPAQVRDGSAGYKGTADAVFQNIRLIEAMQPDAVAVFAADHIYRMDIRQMLDFHLQSTQRWPRFQLICGRAAGSVSSRLKAAPSSDSKRSRPLRGR
jgi:glucose-1-phosphate adenylyltransferase